jgi:hypothetical protein
MQQLTQTAWLAFLLVPTTVRADAIPPQPPCPMGSERVIDGHEVIYCRPTTCGSDADCAGGSDCAPRGVCVAQITRRVASTFPPEPGDPGHEVSWTDVVGPCDASGGCAGGATCETARRCGPRGTPSARGSEPVESEPGPSAGASGSSESAAAEPPREPPSAGCSASRAPRPKAALPLLVASIALGVLALRRRRMRAHALLAGLR